MAEITGSEILARSLKNEGTEILFFLMGGPMLLAEASCIKEGIRPLDVRHEQAAALMGQAYSRLLQKPSVCMAASGPGVINLTTGIANALIDCAPVVAIGGSSPIGLFGRQVFQEIDQLAIMKPCTKWADRVYNLKRIPEQINNAFQKSMSGKPGPVYLDFPGDILYAKIPEELVDWRLSGRPLLRARPMGEQKQVDALVEAIARARRPLILSGSGVIWSQAWDELAAFVEQSGIPFYTTPQGRGVLPDDHPYSYLTMRSSAFRDADLIIIVGTRMNYIIGHAASPRFAADATIARIDVDAEEIATAPRTVAGGNKASDDEPIHPLRLCEEIKNFMERDAILVVDGQEILNYGRQSIPTFAPAHRLNSGPFGTMGVGLPFGLGAKLAKPEKQVIVLHGDGSFGLNALELDTAVRHRIPVLVVISLNGGWTADAKREKPGRELGYTRFDKMAEALGCYGEYVERPEHIRPALERAQKRVDAGMVAVVNVKTDYRARAATVAFAEYST